MSPLSYCQSAEVFIYLRLGKASEKDSRLEIKISHLEFSLACLIHEERIAMHLKTRKNADERGSAPGTVFPSFANDVHE
jgi:hypothetical protein